MAMPLSLRATFLCYISPRNNGRAFIKAHLPAKCIDTKIDIIPTIQGWDVCIAPITDATSTKDTVDVLEETLSDPELNAYMDNLTEDDLVHRGTSCVPPYLVLHFVETKDTFDVLSYKRRMGVN